MLGPEARDPLQPLPASALINGWPAPGLFSQGRPRGHGAASPTTLPAGLQLRMDGHRVPRIEGPDQRTVVLGSRSSSCISFLGRCARSWTMPFWSCLSFRSAVLVGARRPVAPCRPSSISTARSAFVILIGLAAKNAILIVEFAMEHAPRARFDRGGRDRGPRSLAASPDDQLRVHLGGGAAGARHWGRLDQPSIDRHARLRRHARGRAHRGFPDPDAVRGVPVAARAVLARAGARPRPASGRA